MLFHQIALVLRSQVVAPFAGELKLLAGLDGLLQYPDAVGVGQAHEGFLQHTLQSGNERLVDHLVEELQVVLAIVERPAHAVLDEIFLKVHQLFLIDESHLGLHHPELGQMARCVRVFSTERRSERVDGSQGRSAQLAFELSADGERCLLAEEVVVVDNLSVLVLLQVVEVLCRDLEHVAGTFAVARRDERRVEVEEAVLVEIGMDGHGHVVADAHDGTERIGAQAQVRILAHVFEALPFLLHRVVASAESEDGDAAALHLGSLSLGGTLHEDALHTDAGSCGDTLYCLLGEIALVAYNLYALDCAAVIQGYEEYSLRTSLGAYPAFYTNI